MSEQWATQTWHKCDGEMTLDLKWTTFFQSLDQNLKILWLLSWPYSWSIDASWFQIQKWILFGLIQRKVLEVLIPLLQRAWLLCREGGDLATLAVWHVQVPTFPPSLNFFLSTILIQFLEFTKLAVHILSQFLSQFLLPFFHQSSLRYDIGNCLFEAAYEEVLRRYFHCRETYFLTKLFSDLCSFCHWQFQMCLHALLPLVHSQPLLYPWAQTLLQSKWSCLENSKRKNMS